MIDTQLPKGWTSELLVNLADYFNGAAFSERHWGKDGLPIIRIEQINNPEAEKDKYSGPVLPKNYIDTGDLIFSWSATLKVVIWNDGPAVLNQHLYKVVPKKAINKVLLQHILDFNMDRLARQSQGSTMRHVTRKELSRFRVIYPIDPYEQKKIAKILKTIGQAIEKTETLIGKYQRIKSGLMHDLFTRGIGPDGQLRPPREQAPKLYQETPIGWIPKDWNYKPLEHGLSASPKNGYSPKEVDTWQDLYVLGLGCLTKSGFKPVQLKNAPKSALSSGAKLRDGDFLISRSNTQELVGLCGIYRSVGHDMIYPDLMMKLKLEHSLIGEFLERYLLSGAARKRISALAVGTSASMVKLNAASISKLEIVYPSPEEQLKIVEVLKPVEAQLSSLSSQLEKLYKHKSGLTHDLLTGEVRVCTESGESSPPVLPNSQGAIVYAND